MSPLRRPLKVLIVAEIAVAAFLMSVIQANRELPAIAYAILMALLLALGMHLGASLVLLHIERMTNERDERLRRVEDGP